MESEIKLIYHTTREFFSRYYESERTPEPDLIMNNKESVEEYRDSGKNDGNNSSFYLFNLRLLCTIIKPKDVVLDLACGPANLLIELAKLNPDAYFIGIDMSKEMLALAEILKKEKGVTNIDFQLSSITNLKKIQSKSIDLVLSTLSLHHLPTFKHVITCFEETFRVLKKNGNIHFMDFGGLKRKSTIDYFVYERTKDLSTSNALDYHNSIKAAFRVTDYQKLVQRLQKKNATIRLYQTFFVPFFIVISTLPGNRFYTKEQDSHFKAYWSNMKKSQKRDYVLLKFFLKLDGLHSKK